MAHFAEIDANGVVQRVIVAEQDFIDSGKVGDPKNWVQTSYLTKEGVHAEGGTALRGNYAGVGYTYDKVRDVFIPPKTFESWVLDEQKAVWVAPVENPKDGKLREWDEATLQWSEVIVEVPPEGGNI